MGQKELAGSPMRAEYLSYSARFSLKNILLDYINFIELLAISFCLYFINTIKANAKATAFFRIGRIYV